MDISIVIPVFNVEQYIIRCLCSVYSQVDIEGLNIEVILVDDCGNDNSMSIIKDYLSNNTIPFPTSIVTHTANRGLSEARNSGVKIATGKYIYFLDSDDFISSDCLSTLWQEVVKYPNVDIVFGYTQCTPDKHYMESVFIQTQHITKEYLKTKNLRRIYFTLPDVACNKLIRCSLFNEDGLWFKPGMIHEDHYWHITAYSHIKSACLIKHRTPTYLYMYRSDSIANKSKGEIRSSNLYEVYIALIEDFCKLNRIDKYLFKYILTILNSAKHDEVNGIKRKITYTQLWEILYYSKAVNSRQRLLLKYHRLPYKYMHLRVAVFLNNLFC